LIKAGAPGDLGEFLKPFVFLDIFSLADSSRSPFDFIRTPGSPP